ncbi:MAG TPA: class I SAM-dependent methyltransferase, partial [Terriglobales bacterium]|nr:class I SAM-dependent methyltransferase [Terriglobales bacterium]
MNIEVKSEQRVVGAAPVGATDRESASRAVREMFTSIAHRYDLLNHVLSLNTDRYWWWRASRTFRHILQRNDVRVLDLCCGTGDMTFALKKRTGRATPSLMGADFSHAMLQRAVVKSRGTSLRWVEADALKLPLPNERFDLVTSAFGFRNLADYD